MVRGAQTAGKPPLNPYEKVRSAMTCMRCQAILFDMDGVLVDSRAVVERTWHRWAARHGIEAGPIIAVAHGRRTSETLAEMMPHLVIADEVAWLDAAEMDDFDGIVEVSGAAAFVASLPPDRWAIVTSAGRDLALRRLACAGIEAPPILVSSEDVRSGKPSPDGYRLGAERLGFDTSECIVFEDAPPGIEAALAAGADVIALATTQPRAKLGRARTIVPDFTGVRARMVDGMLEITTAGQTDATESTP
jgi:sugar-phosphatase